MIWAIILAAGESKRMGRSKLTLPFGRKSIIENVVENAGESKVQQVLIVLGSNRREIEKKISRFPVRIIENPDYSQGMHTSIQCAIRDVPINIKAVLIMLGDQPSVSSTDINNLIEEYLKSKKGIVLPVFKGKRGHPVLIDLKYRNEINNLNPDIGLREIIRNHSEDIREIKSKSSSILQDIDNPDDYYRELKKI